MVYKNCVSEVLSVVIALCQEEAFLSVFHVAVKGAIGEEKTQRLLKLRDLRTGNTARTVCCLACFHPVLGPVDDLE